MVKRLFVGLSLLIPASLVIAQASVALPALTSIPTAGGGTTYSLTIQTLVLMTALTFIPAAILMMTGFTRIVIVLSLLRHALGTPTSPSNQIIIGLSLFLSSYKPDTLISHDNGGRLNRGENTAKQEAASINAALSSLP